MANSLLLILLSEFTMSIGAGPQSLKDISNSLIFCVMKLGQSQFY